MNSLVITKILIVCFVIITDYWVHIHCRILESNYFSKLSRAARFKLNYKEKGAQINMESLMSEIPGMDNYPVELTDDIEGNVVLDPRLGNKTLNVGYYHRRLYIFK